LNILKTICKLERWLIYPRFPHGWNWHLSQNCGDTILVGCQGFIGPYPSAFLDKHPVWIFKS